MAQAIEEKLLQTIQKDDIETFIALMNEVQCGEYRLGRFPVLSLLYLYNSRKIIKAYEEKFLKISTWKELREPASIAGLFSEKAGKCLRLYLSEVVSPLEMLLILDKTSKLKRLYPLTKPSEAVKARLKSIYSVRYSLCIKFDGNEIIIDRRPLSYREKKRILTVCLSCLLAVAIAVATPVTAVSLFGVRSGGDVTRLSHIDFNVKTTYTLQKDITIPKKYSGKKVNCTIIGNGHKLVLGKGVTLGEFNGKLSDMEIQTSGTPIFTVCTEDAVLSDVTVNVNTDVKTRESTAFITVTNCGTFDGVTMNVSGSLSALAGEEDLIFGGMAKINTYSNSVPRTYGTIKNCTVNYSDFTLDGEVEANATFGGIVGVNYGIVQDCTVTGKITANTFDLAGACYVNVNTLSKITNEADLSQKAESDNWTTIVGGIVIQNESIVEYCKNTGNLTMDSQGDAICGGIVGRSYGHTRYSISTGDITVTAQTAYVGGIFGRSEIAGYLYWGTAEYCISENNIDVTAIGEKNCVGGIGGFVQEGSFVDIYGEFVGYFGGGITNCIFIGEIEGNLNYYGNIVGVCGAHIYETNSYTSNGAEYINFDGNYYIENSLSSFGAVVKKITSDDGTTEDEFATVTGKGATSAEKQEIEELQIYKDILKEFGM